ncbi:MULTISPECIES: SoxR reducing system RseC family protein [Pseudomonas]|uniref:SoxR reducing system RseC family protein n=1 Tax=Pseudomonas sediminis TaxID=1691904 RepID=A0ABX6SDQ8_9PSED|nr:MULTISPECIES: SoxR reducing system RseC family protein [Pseudomonas]MCW1936407.1 SoxR reducing system RseC family protein [Pseudomonas sp. MDMC_285]MDG9758024.1 SoxR reducing system RseC family protein [Pseudomonas sediminis]PKQ42208.1 transcriptional regulator [Pseudomonas sp. YY-1]QNG99998.1 SoxR reducing system RseC family protein [Pseudomonas sediminis]TRO24382.1 transcriptional regulator [Pseudomonas mendocina]
MIEEQGRVVALEPGAVWVETLRKSTCSSCSANAACGQGLMDRLGVGRQRGYVRALSQTPLAVGDTVIIGVREDLLVRSSLLVYLLPLLGLFAAALLADGLGLSEPLVIFAGLSGLLASWLLVRWRAARVAENPLLQPVVLRALLVSVPAAG